MKKIIVKYQHYNGAGDSHPAFESKIIKKNYDEDYEYKKNKGLRKWAKKNNPFNYEIDLYTGNDREIIIDYID